MQSTIEFYFDFSSPYAYIASEMLPALAVKHGRTVTWRPFLLGVAFKVTGGAPLPSIPVKGHYALLDICRSARYHGLAYSHPDKFPISSVIPTRAFYWLESIDPEAAANLARSLLRAYFVANRDISDINEVIKTCLECGIDSEKAVTCINASDTRERTRMEVDNALARGVFGSPYMIVDGEPFWGADRLDHLDKWLADGGF